MARKEHYEEPDNEQVSEEVDDLFVADTGRARKGSAIDVEKLKELFDRAEAAMGKLGNSVVISLPKLNEVLGTSFSNANSLAYGLKKATSTAAILKERNLYVGSKGAWIVNPETMKGHLAPVEEQGIRIVRA